MNTKIIRYIWGYVLRIEAVFMLLPFIIGLIRHDEGFMWFLIVSAGAALISIPLAFRKPTDTVFYLKEGCVATASSWIIMSIVGALPFYLSFRDCIGLYDDRCEHPSGSGIHADLLPILEKLYALDRRYGRSRIPSCSSSDERRIAYQPHACGKPGTFSRQVRS